MSHFRTRVKICCIMSLEEAAIASRYGADALGLVGAMPSGPGIISDETAKQIAARVPPPIASFLLTSETTAQKIQRLLYLDSPEYELVRRGFRPRQAAR